MRKKNQEQHLLRWILDNLICWMQLLIIMYISWFMILFSTIGVIYCINFINNFGFVSFCWISDENLPPFLCLKLFPTNDEYRQLLAIHIYNATLRNKMDSFDTAHLPSPYKLPTNCSLRFYTYRTKATFIRIKNSK